MGELIKYGIKIAISVLIFAALLLAINTLVSVFTAYVIPGPLTEISALVSVFLPWNPSALNFVAGNLILSISFLVALKVYRYLNDLQQQTS